MTTAAVTAPSLPGPRPAAMANYWLAAVLMLACLALAAWMKPTRLLSDRTGIPDLEKIIPHEFGDWKEVPNGLTVVVNPQQAEALRDIYTSTLGRAYVNVKTGRQIMLSIAYGKDQNRDTQMHPPEACYRSQGFRVDRLTPENIRTKHVELPAVRMESVMGLRQEPVTYWMRVGDRLTRGSLDRNLVRMRYAAAGYIADGLLFRVSEVTRAPPADAFKVQDQFLESLFDIMSPADRAELLGKKAL